MIAGLGKNADADRVEQIADRVGHYGIGAWLADLGLWVGAPSPYPPDQPDRFQVTWGRGLEIRLHDPSWKEHVTVPPDAWVLYDVTIAAVLPLPFDLDAVGETPVSAQTKLSQDVNWNRTQASGLQSVTYYMPDLRAVLVTFRPGLVGIDHVKLTRLLDWPDWRARAP